jgi:hypothetical protein
VMFQMQRLSSRVFLQLFGSGVERRADRGNNASAMFVLVVDRDVLAGNLNLDMHFRDIAGLWVWFSSSMVTRQPIMCLCNSSSRVARARTSASRSADGSILRKMISSGRSIARLFGSTVDAEHGNYAQAKRDLRSTHECAWRENAPKRQLVATKAW